MGGLNVVVINSCCIYDGEVEAGVLGDGIYFVLEHSVTGVKATWPIISDYYIIMLPLLDLLSNCLPIGGWSGLLS